MKDYRFGAEAISLLFGDWLHFGVRKGVRVRIRRDEKTKSVVKSVVPTRPANQTIQPTKPTNQSKKKTSSAQGGEQRIY
jgi:hypothetical protein